MILVNLAQTWPKVLSGEDNPKRATLGGWAHVSDEALDTYGDVALGIYKNEVVSAFDITGWQFLEEEGLPRRVEFLGRGSKEWHHLIGQPNPGQRWKQGQSRPVQYLDTRELTEGTVPIEQIPGGRRAAIEGFTLTVLDDGTAHLAMPPGAQLTVLTRS